jgi:hypothetical protein
MSCEDVWPGPDGWTLVEDATGEELGVGSVVGLNGKRYRITYLEPPHRPGTEGRVSAEPFAARRRTSGAPALRYYASVWGCTYKRREPAVDCSCASERPCSVWIGDPRGLLSCVRAYLAGPLDAVCSEEHERCARTPRGSCARIVAAFAALVARADE